MFLRLKLTYSLYNFFHKRKLHHNVPLYKKLGLNKKYYSPVSSVDFKGLNPDLLKNTSKKYTVEECNLFKNSSLETQSSINQFHENGFAILKNYLSKNVVDSANAAVEDLLNTGKIRFVNKNKLMFAIHKSSTLKNIATNADLQELLSALINDEAVLFQSINFLTGSQQRSHSDSVHMTTFPLGGLLGVWIALEDIELDNGPLHYYPKSHKLPYYLNPDYDNVGNSIFIGDKDYTAYEDMLATKIKENNIEKKVFTAKKGDLLIWHANLMHGGEPHTNKNKTRKSMVLHYYAKNCICYHEIKQRPALI